jgi:hypothetical protein
MPFLISGAAFPFFGTILGTKGKKMKHTLGMKQDKVEKPYKTDVFRDRGRESSKEWYIEFLRF